LSAMQASRPCMAATATTRSIPRHRGCQPRKWRAAVWCCGGGGAENVDVSIAGFIGRSGTHRDRDRLGASPAKFAARCSAGARRGRTGVRAAR
jgi:hypothetical protein